MTCPRTQQANLPACSPQRPLHAERQAGKLWIPFFKVFWYDSTREMNPRSGRSNHNTIASVQRRTTILYLICANSKLWFLKKVIYQNFRGYCNYIVSGDVHNAAREVNFCGPRKGLQMWRRGPFLEINTFKATFITNFSNVTCADQFCYGDRFDRITSLWKRWFPKKMSSPLWTNTNFDRPVNYLRSQKLVRTQKTSHSPVINNNDLS